jgi:uncharacterized protein (DUF2147 family)
MSFDMRFFSKAFSLSAGTALAVLAGTAWLLSRARPVCTHNERSYGFPMTVDGRTTRTCSKCGHKREYDMANMRFVDRTFRQRTANSA